MTLVGTTNRHAAASPSLLAGERPFNTDKVCSRTAVLRDSRQRIYRSVFSHGNLIDVSRPLAVLKGNRALVGVLSAGNVIRYQMKVLDAFRFAHGGFAGELL